MTLSSFEVEELKGDIDESKVDELKGDIGEFKVNAGVL